MTRAWQGTVLVGAMVATGCFTDVATGGEGASSEADPAHGEAQEVSPAGAVGGHYELDMLTIACAGDCTGPTTLLGPVVYCDVGDRDSDFIAVAQDAERLVLDLWRGRMEGTIDDEGSFLVRGESTEGGGTVVLSATMTGAFAGRHARFTGTLAYVASGTHDGDAIDCRGEIEVTGIWESDGCDDDPDVCPEAYPLCHRDACNAGVSGDPCDDAEHCAAGLVCFDRFCRDAGAPGDACHVDDHCAQGHRCYENLCQAGAVGDPCVWEDDCALGLLCHADRCQTGAVGDACSSDTHCADDLRCYDEHCQAGDVGEPCSFAGHCAQGNACVDGRCTAGEPGNPCLWQEDCDSHACIDDVCA